MDIVTQNDGTYYTTRARICHEQNRIKKAATHHVVGDCCITYALLCRGFNFLPAFEKGHDLFNAYFISVGNPHGVLMNNSR